ncbi:MAG: M14 family zinc carboxypeptidase [Phycisphaerae bacterium]
MTRLGGVVAVLALCAVHGALAEEVVRFDGHRVVRATVRNADELNRLLSLTHDVWSERVGIGPVDVRVTPAEYERLRNSGLRFQVLIDDVQGKIDNQFAKGPEGVDPFLNYMDNATVNAYLATLAALRPDLAQVVTVGTTLEGRTIQGLRITGPGAGPKPGVLFHGCEHAREWISVPVTLYVADQLVRNYDADPMLHDLVDRCEWFIIPVFNVDGYLYTWSTNRLWRKNRRNNGDGSFGVDINRNWGFHWGGEGASTLGSDETFRGPSAFSEPETQAMRDFFLAHTNIVTHEDLHSYSQLILWPWGYQSPTSPDEPEFNLIGTTMQSIILGVHGVSYRPGAIYNNIYPASGVSVDWCYGTLGIRSFSIELRDTGASGFVLPATQIRPNCEEIFPALIYQADYTTTPVHIALPNGAPTLVAPGAPANFAVRITDGRQTVDPAGATLYVRSSPSDPYVGVPIAHVSGNDYTATIPSQLCSASVQFYIVAGGLGGGQARSPGAAPTAYYPASVGTTAYSFNDNFETDQGWTVTNVSLSTGAWVRADPVGTFSGSTPVQPEDDNPAGVGTLCYVTANGSPGGGVGAADVDGGPTILTSPRIDLSAVADPYVNYYRWFYCSSGTGSGADFLTVEISNNDGASWVTLESITHDPGWKPKSFRVSNYVPPSSLMRLRFSVADQPNGSTTEAAIDDVTVTTFSCVNPVVTGDMNCDGLFNANDVAPFVQALVDEAGYAAAYPGCARSNGDLNASTTIDGDDAQQFVALLLALP